MYDIKTKRSKAIQAGALAMALGLAALILTPETGPAALPEGRSLEIESQGAGYNLRWLGITNAPYEALARTNLVQGDWGLLDTIIGADGPTVYPVPPDDSSSRFFRVLFPRPAVTAGEPAFVPEAGGTTVYVTGQFFYPGDQIRVDGVLLSNVTFISSTLLSGTLPDLPPGLHAVAVVSGNSGAVLANLPGALEVSPPPERTLQGPPEWPPAGPAPALLRRGGLVGQAVAGLGGLAPALLRSRGTIKTINSPPRLAPSSQEDGHVTVLKSRGGGHVTVLKSRGGGGDDDCDGVADLRLHSGEVRQQVTDLAVPGRGLDFVWTRTYRSRTGVATAQGNRWTHGYDVHCIRNGTAMDVYGGTGHVDIFRLQSNGTYTCPEFFREGTLDAATETFRLTFADTGYWEFNPLGASPSAGKLAQIVDRNGNTMTLEYDGAGRLTAIVDDLARTHTVAYTPAGQIASVTDFSGRTVLYEYDGESNLTACVSPAVTGTSTGNDFPGGKTNRYTYSTGHADERENHLLLSVIDGLGQTSHRYVYQHNQTDADFLRCISLQRGTNQPTRVTYLPQTPTPDNRFAALRCIVNDPEGNVSEATFDVRNRCVSLREYTGRATPGQPVTEASNRPSGKLRADDPDVFESRWSWNNDSLCTVWQRPLTNRVEWVYQADLDTLTPPRQRGNLREERRIANGDVDGDGRADVAVFRFEHDPRFGSIPDAAVALASKTRITMQCEDFILNSFPTRIIDPRGNETHCTYDDAGNRTEVRHGLDVIIDTTEYLEGGMVIARKGPANGGVEVPGQEERRDEFTYYEDGPQRGYLKEQIIDAGPGRLNLTTTYEYDAVGNVTRIIDPRGNDTLHTYNALNQIVRSQSALVSADVPVRYTTLHFYDANDNLVRTRIENRDETGAPGAPSFFDVFYEVDILDRVTAITRQVDENHSATTRFEYDANGNLSRLLKPEAVNGNDPLNIVQYQYDERDLLFRRTRAPGGALQSTDGFDYDANRNLFRSLSGMDSETEVVAFTYHYDGFSRLVGSTDAMGNGPTYDRDANGNVVRVHVFGETNDVAGAANNRLLSETTIGHNPLNRPALRVDSFFDIHTGLPIGDGARTTTFEYTDSQHLRSVTDDHGNVTQYTYDSAHRPIRTTDPRGNSVTRTYDPNGNIVSLSNTNKSDVVPQDQVFITEYQYDNLDRLIRATDNVGNTTQYGYDSRGNRVSVIDPRGTPARYEYDGLSRIISFSQDVDGNGGLDRLGTYVWDDNSRLLASTDPNDNATQYAYDPLDRLVRTTFADQTAHTNSYDARDNLTVSRDANNTLVTTQYDLLNRVTNKTILPGSGVANTTTFERYQYDGLSRLVRAENDSATHTFVWNSLAGPSSETVNGRTVAYTYDALGNRLSVAYPGGQMVTYSYDSLNRVSGVGSIPFAGGALATVVSNHYVGPNRIARRDLGNSLRTRVHYNGEVGTPNAQGDFGRGQVSRIRHAAPGAAPIIDERAFAYDANQNKTARWLTTPFGPGGQTNQQTFGYDRLHRLTRATVTLGADLLRDTHYELDLAGNRLQVIDGLYSGPYTMDAAPPPGPADFQMNQYTTTGCDAREYDENGNLRATESGGKVIVRGWDAKNRLVSITDPDSGVIAEYAYDALDRRIRKTLAPGSPDEQATEYVYDGANVIEERDDFDAVRMAITLDGDPLKEESHLLLMTQDGQDFYYHTDDLGNVLALTDAAGNVVERYEYDDYGAPMFLDPAGNPLQGATESVVGNPYLFHGHRWDSEAALYHCKRSGDPIMEWTFDKGWPGRYEGSRLTTAFDPAAGRALSRGSGVSMSAPFREFTKRPRPLSRRAGWRGEKLEKLLDYVEETHYLPTAGGGGSGGSGSGGVQFMNKAQLVDLILKDKKAGFDSKAAAERAFDAVIAARSSSTPGGGSFMPIVITGSRFDNPTIPFINGVPSVSLFNLIEEEWQTERERGVIPLPY